MDHAPVLALQILLGALAWDLVLGEPPTAVHPVVWIGRLVRALERVAPRDGPILRLLWGTLMAIAVPTVATLVAWAILHAASGWPVLHAAMGIYLLKGQLALRALRHAAIGVRDPLLRGDVDRARGALRSLCSRDPSTLTAPELAAATVESLAENASDSFVGPLFFYVLLGVPGAVFYRAANTMDAMIGYHGSYEHLGKAAARLDDLLNLVPARFTALLLLLAGALAGGDVRNGLRVWRRDAGKTESPNAGHPMAMMAGLLRVRLAKAGHYALGDDIDPIGPAVVDRAWRIVLLASVATSTIAATPFVVWARSG